MTINEIDYALEKVKWKALVSHTVILKRLKKTQLIGCYTLVNEVVYSLDKDKQDALDNITISDTIKIKELKATLLPWLHELVDAFSKRVTNTLP
jgi:hypothetical protein